jgi:hypothetical protein
MRSLKVLAMATIGTVGLGSALKFLEPLRPSTETGSKKTPDDYSKALTEDLLLERLDVDQFQQNHGQLVATNHVK